MRSESMSLTLMATTSLARRPVPYVDRRAVLAPIGVALH